MKEISSCLLLSYRFNSANSTSTVRANKMAIELSNFYSTVEVLTVDDCSSMTLSENINTHEINAFSLKRRLKNGVEKGLIKEEQKDNFTFRHLFKFIKSFPINIFLGEANILYIISCIKLLEKIIREKKISMIFSSFVPYGDHYIAYYIKGKYPEIKWVADFRDLQIEPIYKNVYFEGLQRWMEKKVLSRADIITTVSEGLVKHLSEYERPAYSIMRGMEKRIEITPYEKFTFSYTGSLFKEYRDPRPFFATLKQLISLNNIDHNDIQIIYAGKDSDLFHKWISEASLESVFVNKELINRNEAQEIQDKSHINLLLTSSSPEITGVLTGKVFEYIESGNATLCLINGVKDPEFETLFSDLNAGKVVYHPELVSGAMEHFILEKYNEWKNTGTVERKVDFDKIKAEHSWKSRVEFMLNKLEEQNEAKSVL